MILKLLKKKEVLLNGKTHVNGADGVGVLNGKNGYAGDDRTENPVMDYRPGANGKSSRNGQDFLIELHGIEKIYETEAGPFLALKAIDLNINEGEFVAIIGKSGSGKSTLINMLTGIDHPTAGDVRIGDARLGDLNEGQMATWRGSNMGIVFQFFQLLPTLTIVENVMIPMDLAQKYDPAERYERAMNLLQLVDMAEEAHKYPSAVSGGQQQRVAIARALANDPPILVADEPTGNLDSRSAESIFALFEDLVAAGKTVLMVTHDDDLSQRVRRSITLADGEIVAETMTA